MMRAILATLRVAWTLITGALSSTLFFTSLLMYHYERPNATYPLVMAWMLILFWKYTLPWWDEKERKESTNAK